MTGEDTAPKANPEIAEQARACKSRAAAAAAQGRLLEAEWYLREAARLHPAPEVYCELGAFLRQLGKPETALLSYECAIRLKPDHAEAHKRRGTLLGEMGRWEAAVASYRTALRVKPDDAGAHKELGMALGEIGCRKEAIKSFQQAVSLAPDNPDFHFCHGAALLRARRFDEGMKELQRSCENRPPFRRPFSQPLWDGRRFFGRTLLLHAVGGFGDTLEYVHYVPLAARRGSRLLLECQPQLKPLLQRLTGPSMVLGQGEPIPEFDVHCHLPLLPFIFTARVAGRMTWRLARWWKSFRTVPCLSVDPALIERWGRVVSGLAGYKVGIVWQGSGDMIGRNPSAPLAAFAPLADIPGIQLVSLQVGPGIEQQAVLGAPVRLVDFGPERYPFEQGAALIMNLDLVVSVDTSVAHLAAALERPVWKILRRGQGHNPFHDPWYTNMRTFQQTRRGDWTGVIDQVAAELRALVENKKE